MVEREYKEDWKRGRTRALRQNGKHISQLLRTLQYTRLTDSRAFLTSTVSSTASNTPNITTWPYSSTQIFFTYGLKDLTMTLRSYGGDVGRQVIKKRVGK